MLTQRRHNIIRGMKQLHPSVGNDVISRPWSLIYRGTSRGAEVLSVIPASDAAAAAAASESIIRVLSIFVFLCMHRL